MASVSRARTWKCQHVAGGEKCGHDNPRTKIICEECGVGRRPKRQPPAHRWTLDVFPYAVWVLFFGERCGICGAEPKPGKKLHRDHDHRNWRGPFGGMRGLLCWQCNSKLHYNADIEWMRNALAYMEKTADR